VSKKGKRKRSSGPSSPTRSAPLTEARRAEATCPPKLGWFLALIRYVPQFVSEILKHHIKAVLVVGVVSLSVIFLFLVLRKPSDCIEIDTHFLGKIRVGCSSPEIPSPDTLTDGLHDDQYTDRRAGFTLSLE
jgi:hypothetical protein